MKKIQYWTLRIFLSCMIICAGLALVLIWSSPDDFGMPNQLMITFFIVGLASFLIWFTTMVLEIRDNCL